MINKQMERLQNLVSKFRQKYNLYNLRSEGAKFVKREFGEEYVEEFLTKYDMLNHGEPIGGFVETVVFLDLIETIRDQI